MSAFNSSRFLVVALLVACATGATALTTLANAGVPPDLVGTFVSDTDTGAIGIDGSFIYQDAGSDGGGAYTGRYLSYACLPDGSFDLVFVHHTFDTEGNINGTDAGCGHGYFIDGLFTSYYAQTEICPFDGTVEQSVSYHVYTPGSTLGALSGRPFCSSLRRGVLDHPIQTPDAVPEGTTELSPAPVTT